MKIGFLTPEYSGFKDLGTGITARPAHGGFGYIAKKKCEYLSSKGHEVHVFVPAPNYDKDRNYNRTLAVGGVNIHLFKTVNYFRSSPVSNSARIIREYLFGVKSLSQMLEEFPVDVYHSEEPGPPSNEIRKRSSRHLLLFCDPVDDYDLKLFSAAWTEFNALARQLGIPEDSTIHQNRFLALVSDRIISKRALRNRVASLLKSSPPSHVYSMAKLMSEKVQKIYNLNYTPRLLRHPIDSYQTKPKSGSPMVLWLNRWDPVKRPQLALEVAKASPEIQFYFVGRASGMSICEEVERALIQEYSKYPNIKIMGFVTDEEKRDLLNRAWALLSTSLREGLPATFIEAGMAATPIVATVNPDNYTEEFGRFAQNREQLVDALREAVRDEWYKSKGRSAHEYMVRVHETEKVMNEHLAIYNQLVNGG